jgi:YVTN family beta-propeller protein
MLALSGVMSTDLSAQGSFVNFETPHVHPLDLTPDGTLLLAVNTADARLEVFDTTGPGLTLVGSVSVGFDPVSVRARNNAEAWVVNQISDSVSIIDLASLRVVDTLDTRDEPCDVVFAGSPLRAFVSCSQVNEVLVFDPDNLALAPVVVAIDAEEPRALAVSPDGNTVYAAIFESGNGSTVLGGGSTLAGGFPPNTANMGGTPHGGVNPPPNDGGSFDPPQNPANPAPPKVALIVKKDAANAWRDDTGGNWTLWVNGAFSLLSGRVAGWDLPDRDVAMIDTATLSVTYVTRLMNINMGLAVNPVSGHLAVVGTDATNEVRFEPMLKGRFLRVNVALVDPAGPTSSVVDLNDHLDYSSSSVSQGQRDLSLGDPRGVAFDTTGTRAYITGMGSNNIAVIDSAGARAGIAPTIEVGSGPTGVVVHDAADRLYVLDKFEAAISVVDLTSETEIDRVPFYDPTPSVITTGRRHLYSTHDTSGLGQIACGSCHVDSRMDRLAWDLGDPAGDEKSVSGQNLGANVPGLNSGFDDWHPMKGPMTTQTLQDIIGKEPLHWRGDKDGLEEFNGAFVGLQGDDVGLTPTEMQEFEDFLATLHFPPNPFRDFFNGLPTALDLSGHTTTGEFGPPGQPLGIGNAVEGLSLFRPPNLLDLNALACATCHTLPTGVGPDLSVVGFTFQPIAPGPNGERHHALVSMDGSTNTSLKIPQLRNLYDKVGFELSQTESRAGFGFIHDGSVDTIARFITEPIFNLSSDQEVADMVAFMLSFTGSDLPSGSLSLLNLEPPGPASQDAHAAVGRQSTLVDVGSAAAAQLTLLSDMIGLADAGDVALIVKGVQAGLQRGYSYVGGGMFQSDRSAETLTSAALQAGAASGSELTFTVVPAGTQTRAGIDRDEDTYLDRDELDAGSDPANPFSIPGTIDVHVAAIDVLAQLVTSQRVSGGTGALGGVGLGQQGEASAVVTIVDANDIPIPGATVTASWSGAVTAMLEAITDVNGQVTFQAGKSPLRNACFTLTVESVSGDALLYDPLDNVETSDAAGPACP